MTRYGEILAEKTRLINLPCADPVTQVIHDQLSNFDRLMRVEGVPAPEALQQVFGKVEEVKKEKPLSDNGKAFFISVSLACFSEVREAEDGKTQASVTRRKKLKALQGDLGKVTRLFTPEGFEYEDMKKAEILYEQVNALIRAAYPE